MRLVLDSGALSDVSARGRARLEELERRGHWPPQVPAVVLAESLTGDHRKDYAVNRLLKACQICDVDELTARAAARLRAASPAAARASATDAIVVACAVEQAPATVLTSDPRDLRALAEGSTSAVAIVRV